MSIHAIQNYIVVKKVQNFLATSYHICLKFKHIKGSKENLQISVAGTTLLKSDIEDIKLEFYKAKVK